MKKYLFVILAAFAVSVANAEWKPFICKNGEYKLFDEKTDIVPTFKPSEDCPKGSFNYYTYCLGYGTGEVISFFANRDGVIALNAFNNDILFVLPMDENKRSLTQKEVDKMMSAYEPKADEFARNLQSGIEMKSIRQSFVEKSLGVKATNNSLKDDMHGYTYTFRNGIMVECKNSSGYSDDAIFIKENLPNFFERFERNAKRFYAINSSIIAYINGQCKYLMVMPQAYINKAPNSNYALLYCILNEGMTLDEFNLLVPEAEISSSIGNYVNMSCGNYMFTFKDKVLVKK